MKKDYDAFEPGGCYHVYSHANGTENLFRSSENYRYFLVKYRYHIHPVAETLAYCLMPNHIHFLVRVRSEESLRCRFAKKYPDKELPEHSDWAAFTMQHFRNWLNAYTKAYNKYYARRGALFLKFTKRKHVSTDDYFTRLIVYIHRNPIHHGFTRSLTDWRFNSYSALLSEEPTLVARREVLDWFGGRDNFIRQHQLPPAQTS